MYILKVFVRNCAYTKLMQVLTNDIPLAMHVSAKYYFNYKFLTV